MRYWLTIALIVCPALFAVRIGAVGQQSAGTMSSSKPESLVDSKKLVKRASFMPSRGKKENQLDSEDKRASSFLPSRGRKDTYSDSEPHNWYVGPPQAYAEDKRAGFMPMRGRKSSAYPSDNEAETVADIYPVELSDVKRSSFMPMRGRKDDFAYDQSFGRPAYAVPQPYRPSTHSVDNTNWMEGEHRVGAQSAFGGGPAMDKKANSFFGARGKRSANEASIGQSTHETHHKNHENFFATRG